MLHGLPSGYNRDFHEEKELLFASLKVNLTNKLLFISCRRPIFHTALLSLIDGPSQPAIQMATRCANLVPAVVRSTTFNKDRMQELCDKNFMTATELANYLVLHHNVGASYKSLFAEYFYLFLFSSLKSVLEAITSRRLSSCHSGALPRDSPHCRQSRRQAHAQRPQHDRLPGDLLSSLTLKKKKNFVLTQFMLIN